MIAPELLEQKNKERKNAMEGQMSLFDFADEETKDDFFRLACSDASAYRKHPLGFGHHEGLSAVEVYSQSLKKS